MKTVLIGANGQLGRDLRSRLPGDVLPFAREHLDLDKPETIAPALAAVRPDRVVNCAAYNFVDKAEADPDAAFRTNAWGVRELARACRDLGAPLVHFSTDYVFGLDATRTSPLRETDPPGPVSVYGLSKLTGEYVVLAASPANVVVRTCGLYGVWGAGGKGGNFVETMLRVAGQGKPLRVVNDQHCTPTYTADLADAVVALLAAGGTGLFHLTSGGATTWHNLAAETFRLAGVTADLTPITSAEFNAPAKRPPYSVLSTDRAAALIPPPRPWQAALAAYLTERKARTA